MTHPGMAFVFVVGVGLATFLYYMFSDNNSNNNNTCNSHGDRTHGTGPPPSHPNSWSTSSNRSRSSRRGSSSNEVTDCGICLDTIQQNGMRVRCGHLFHKSCLGRWQNETSEEGRVTVRFRCPLCRGQINTVY